MSSITPESLLQDNRSPLATEAMKQWREARSNGDLTIWWGCADARLLRNPKKSIHLASIATGGDRKPYEKLLNDERVQGIIVVNHYAKDPESARKPGEIWIPEGCGGLSAKGQLLNGMPLDSDADQSILGYINKHVSHPDVVFQAYTAASLTAEHTDKPVLAVAQNHLDGSIIPVAAFLDRGRVVIPATPLHRLFMDQYDPQAIYSNGIPRLTEDRIPEIFMESLAEAESYAQRLRQEYPNLAETQRTQNPGAVVITTEIKPLGAMLPDHFSRPDSAFRLTVPRGVIEETTSQHYSDALNQAEYPLLHSVENAGTNKGFSKLDTILIETGRMQLSEDLAEKLLREHPVARQWIGMQGKQIIIAETRAGEIQTIRGFQ